MVDNPDKIGGVNQGQGWGEKNSYFHLKGYVNIFQPTQFTHFNKLRFLLVSVLKFGII